MNILIAGGAGFIGANFERYRRRSRPADRIVVLDARSYEENLGGLDSLCGEDAGFLVDGDNCGAALIGNVFGKFDFDAVVHFAAESRVDRSIHTSAAFTPLTCALGAVAHSADRGLPEWDEEATRHSEPKRCSTGPVCR